MPKDSTGAFHHIVTENELVTKKDLDIALANVKHDILKWMVTAMIAQTALLVGIIAFLR